MAEWNELFNAVAVVFLPIMVFTGIILMISKVKNKSNRILNTAFWGSTAAVLFVPIILGCISTLIIFVLVLQIRYLYIVDLPLIVIIGIIYTALKRTGKMNKLYKAARVVFTGTVTCAVGIHAVMTGYYLVSYMYDFLVGV